MAPKILNFFQKARKKLGDKRLSLKEPRQPKPYQKRFQIRLSNFFRNSLTGTQMILGIRFPFLKLNCHGRFEAGGWKWGFNNQITKTDANF